MTDHQPYLVQLGDVQNAVVHALFDSLPRDGWTSCIVECRQAGRVVKTRAVWSARLAMGRSPHRPSASGGSSTR